MRAHVVLCARFAEQDEFPTDQVGAVVELVRRCAAALAAPENFGLCAELLVHSRVKDVERSLPKTRITKLLRVADYAALKLIDLAKSTILHNR